MGRHSSLTDPAEIHEPKGTPTANSGEVKVADGLGAAPYRKLGRNELSDLKEHYGQQTITNNATSIAVTAAVDPTLATNSDYIQVAGIFDGLPSGLNNGVTQQVDQLTVTEDGVYRVDLWADTASSVINTVVAYKFAVNGVISLGRRPKTYLANTGEFLNCSAYGLVQLTAGDIVTLWFASDKTANITIEDAVFSLTMVRAL